MDERTGRPECHRCAAYFITYDPRHPYGCRTFSVKSKLAPSLVVRNASGEECHAFEPKQKPPRRERGGLYG